MNHQSPPTAGEPTLPGSPETALQNETETHAKPQIWVASLADYNNGLLHGTWLDADQTESELQAGITSMLAQSPLAQQSGEVAQEWAIFDSEGFGPAHIDEQESLRWVSRVGQGITRHGPAFAAWADVVEEEERLAGFEDAYVGHYDDVEGYVEELIDDLGYDRLLNEAVPASLRPYVKIDIAAIANDLLLGGDIHALPANGDGVWIFREG